MKCEHLEAAPADADPSTHEGCPECLKIGFYDWVHLRICLTCGQIGCCDSSPYQHATGHFNDVGHPVMRSFEPGETWKWCYVDELIG
jgi:hypothetical protein